MESECVTGTCRSCGQLNIEIDTMESLCVTCWDDLAEKMEEEGVDINEPSKRYK